MNAVRRVSVGVVVAGLVLLGGPAWAQEDPCAPEPDGSVPEMCREGAAPEPAEEPTEEDPCAGARPVEPGDGVVTDGEQSEDVDESEPRPETPTEESSGETKPDSGAGDAGSEEPAPEEEPLPEEVPTEEEAPTEEEPPTMVAPTPGEDDGVVCAYTGAPVSSHAGASAGAGQAGAPGNAPVLETAGSQNTATAAGQLPRTGPYDQVLALAAVASVLLILGAAAAVAGRRRPRQA